MSPIRAPLLLTNRGPPCTSLNFKHAPYSRLTTQPPERLFQSPREFPSTSRHLRSVRNGTQGGEEAGREEARGGGEGTQGGGEEATQGREAATVVQGRRRRRRQEGQEEGEEERRDLQDLHLQGAEAGAPGHRHLRQGHVHHELLHQRHLREARAGGGAPRQVQQEAHHHVARDPDLGPPRPPRRARQARCLRGHQGRHQVHLRLEW